MSDSEFFGALAMLLLVMSTIGVVVLTAGFLQAWKDTAPPPPTPPKRVVTWCDINGHRYTRTTPDVSWHCLYCRAIADPPAPSQAFPSELGNYGQGGRAV